ncbi:MAG: glycosyltransferase family 4 protein [Gemmatimonadales bacterium]
MTTARVLHVASGREWRGGQRQVLLLARGLAAEPGIASLVVTGRGTRLAHELTTAGVTLLETPWRLGLDPRALARVVRMATPETILHAHDGHAHALADAAAQITGARVVVSRRISTPITAPRRYRRAAAVIALSEAIAAQVAAAGVPAHRTHRVPPAVDLARLDPPPPWPTGLQQPDPASRWITVIAALTPEKGVDLLLEAAALVARELPAVRWLVLGDGSERASLEARRHRLGLDDVVAMPGHLTGPEGALVGAELAVQPSRQEGFGSSVLDALALGVPVVATAVGGLPDALALGGGVLVPAGDPVALAETVVALLADAPRRDALGAAGRAAATRFGVERLVERTLAVYRSLDLHPGD